MPALTDRAFADVAAMMHERVGLAFGEHKRLLVAARLAPRLRQLGLDSYEQYVALLQSDHEGSEFQAAVDMLTTNETYFFREPAHFELLEQELLRTRACRVSVWSAASSFGDEAYSTAMLLSDMQRLGRIDADWYVLGTDISERAVHGAAAGIYSAERLRHVSPERLKRYCLRGEGCQQGLVAMQPELCERVRFGQLNLCADLLAPLPGAPFDFVFLRNVLLYFDAHTRSAVVDRVLTQLRPGGMLFMGMAEGRVACRTALAVVGPGAFRKPASA